MVASNCIAYCHCVPLCVTMTKLALILKMLADSQGWVVTGLGSGLVVWVAEKQRQEASSSSMGAGGEVLWWMIIINQRWEHWSTATGQLRDILQWRAWPWNIKIFLSGVIALRGASGDQWAVPETMSRRTLPYWAQSSDTGETPAITSESESEQRENWRNTGELSDNWEPENFERSSREEREGWKLKSIWSDLS